MKAKQITQDDGQYIDNWILTFKNSVDEEKFAKFMHTSLIFPKLFKGTAFLALGLNFAYRVCVLIIAILKVSLPNAGYPQELYIFTFLTACFVIEGVLRYTGKFLQIHGLMLYVSLGVSYVTSAFLAFNAPLFGIP